MATLVSDIILDSYRESNLIAVNATPTGAQTEEALRLLQRILSLAYGFDAGEEMSNLSVGLNNLERPTGFPDFTQTEEFTENIIPDNTRLLCNLTEPAEFWLSPTPNDGARFAIVDVSGNLETNNLTINGNGNLIEDAPSYVYALNELNIEYVYRADLGKWLRVTPLETGAIWPFPQEYDDMFITALAIRLSPRYEAEIAPGTLAAYKNAAKAFKARYRQRVDVWSELGLIRLTTPSNNFFDNVGPRSANSMFNRGFPYFYGRTKW